MYDTAQPIIAKTPRHPQHKAVQATLHREKHEADNVALGVQERHLRLEENRKNNRRTAQARPGVPAPGRGRRQPGDEESLHAASAAGLRGTCGQRRR